MLILRKIEGLPFNIEVLGRVLDPAKGDGNKMVQWILKENGRVISLRMSRLLKVYEIHSSKELNKREIFNGLIERRWGKSNKPPTYYMDSDKEQKKYKDYY